MTLPEQATETPENAAAPAAAPEQGAPPGAASETSPSPAASAPPEGAPPSQEAEEAPTVVEDEVPDNTWEAMLVEEYPELARPKAAPAGATGTTEQPPAASSATGPQVTQSTAPELPPTPSPVTQPAQPAAPAPQPPPDPAVARAQLLQELEKAYVMDGEQAAEFEATPEKAWPKLAARLHANVFEQGQRAIAGALPQLVAQIVQDMENSRAVERKFYGEWPKLDKPEYKPHVDRIALIYRRANPTAPLDQMIKEVGAAASVALRVLPDQPAAPETPMPRPVQPPLPGVGATPPAKPGLFESIAEEFIQEDRQ